VLKRVPEHMKLPSLRRQLMNLQSLREFKSYVAEHCNIILKADSIGLQKQLNQLQRKSVKVNPSETRCYVCSRPLFQMSTPKKSARSSSSAGGGGRTRANNIMGRTFSAEREYEEDNHGDGYGRYDRASLSQTNPNNMSTVSANGGGGSGSGAAGGPRVWGRPIPQEISHSEVVVFSPKIAYHRACFDAVAEGQDGNGSMHRAEAEAAG